LRGAVNVKSAFALQSKGLKIMAWSTPEIREVCVGMEVTSYLSAEM
jgi:coenzyme PQQ precursor peptide PqqA